MLSRPFLPALLEVGEEGPHYPNEGKEAEIPAYKTGIGDWTGHWCQSSWLQTPSLLIPARGLLS